MSQTKAQQEKRSAALTSVLAALGLTGMKLVVGIATNSLGILAEALHSSLDLAAAAVTYFAVRLSDKPPDSEHLFGHGKVENLSALFETALLLITSAWVLREGYVRLFVRSVEVDPSVWAFLVMGVSVVVDFSRSRMLYRAARKHNSQALEADALHFASDVWSSLVVIAGLVFVSFGYPALDSVAAIAVALLVLFVSYRLGRRTLDALVDRVPEGVYDQVLAAVAQVDGVQEVRQLRLRPSGPHLFVDATVGIPRTMPFARAHSVMDAVESAVHDARSKVDVTVHAEPMETSEETLADKVRMVALERGLRAPHNLEVHRIDGRHFIDFDLEVPSGKSFVEAHGIAVDVEQEIRRRIDAVERVTVHLEEYQQEEAELREVTDEQRALGERIRARMVRDDRVLGCSDVTLLRFGNVYNVSVTCQVDSTRSLAGAHRIVAELESELYREFEQLRRVTIRAVPADTGGEG
jgi:cation diffusion facilitator family transporter